MKDFKFVDFTYGEFSNYLEFLEEGSSKAVYTYRDDLAVSNPLMPQYDRKVVMKVPRQFKSKLTQEFMMKYKLGRPETIEEIMEMTYQLDDAFIYSGWVFAQFLTEPFIWNKAVEYDKLTEVNGKTITSVFAPVLDTFITKDGTIVIVQEKVDSSYRAKDKVGNGQWDEMRQVVEAFEKVANIELSDIRFGNAEFTILEDETIEGKIVDYGFLPEAHNNLDSISCDYDEDCFEDEYNYGEDEEDE